MMMMIARKVYTTCRHAQVASTHQRPLTMSTKQAKRRPETNRAPSSSSQPKAKVEAKFYNGPTVSAKTQQVAEDARVVANRGVKTVQVKSSQLKDRAKRHPFALLSLISALPTFLLLSLLSTVVCPPPSAPPSFLSKVNPFTAKHAYSELQQTLCYPSNVYYDNVLQPYVYPKIDALKSSVLTHPVYRTQVEPRLAQAQIVASSVYERPIKPVLRRTSNGARKFYLTLVEPHLPFLRAQYHTATAPIKHQVSAIYKTYAAPHVTTASAYAKAAYAKITELIAALLGHPLAHQARKHAVGGYHLGRRASTDAYVKSKPYAIEAGTRTERFMREVVGPNALVATRWVLVQAENGWQVISTNLALFYRLHIRPYAAPYLEIIAPHVATVRKSVYTPYIAPIVARYLPHSEPVADATGKGFLTSWFDRVVSPQQKQYEQDLDSVRKPQRVPVPDAHHLKTGPKAAKVPVTKEEKKDMAEGRQEMVRVREAIKLRVDKAGRAAVEDFEAELESSYADAVEKFPQWRVNHRQTLAKERDNVLLALDKLFTKSTTLNKDMIPTIRSQALSKFAKGLKIARDELDGFKLKVEQRELPVLQKKQDDVLAALGPEYEQLRASMAYLDGVTAKDWKAFNALKTDVDAWSRKLHGIFEGTVKSSVDRHRKFLKLAYPEASTELDDIFEEFKHNVEVHCRAALSKHEAKEELAKLSASASSSASDGRVSILPVAGVAGAAGAAIGKGKQQVLDALSAANEAMHAATSTAPSGVEYVKSVGSDAAASAASAYDAVVSSASEAVAGKAAPAGVDYVKSVGNDAAASAASAYDAVVSNAASVAHDASKTVVSALGGTPSPESPREHAASIAAAAAVEFEAMTAGIKNALGAGRQPSPLASSASAYLASATSAGTDAYATGSALLASLLSEASASIHSGTRSLSKAVGATPTPETPKEYIESVAAAAAEATASVKAALGRDEL